MGLSVQRLRGMQGWCGPFFEMCKNKARPHIRRVGARIVGVGKIILQREQRELQRHRPRPFARSGRRLQGLLRERRAYRN